MSSYRSVVCECTYLSSYVVIQACFSYFQLHMTQLSFQQLWTVALCLAQPMAKLLTLLEQHLDRQPPTAVMQATTCWGTVLKHVRLQECGLGMHLPVTVCCCYKLSNLSTFRQHIWGCPHTVLTNGSYSPSEARMLVHSHVYCNHNCSCSS